MEDSSRFKFRAWDKEEMKLLGDIEYGDRYCNDFAYYLNNDRYMVMQYTGLKDKNEVEIYEGDIVNFKYKDKESIYKVLYYDGGFALIFSMTREEPLFSITAQYCEVMGNIYENQELLEVK